MILEVLTLRLFQGRKSLKSLNFKTSQLYDRQKDKNFDFRVTLCLRHIPTRERFLVVTFLIANGIKNEVIMY